MEFSIFWIFQGQILDIFGIFLDFDDMRCLSKEWSPEALWLSVVAQGHPRSLGGLFGYNSIRFRPVSEVVSSKSGATDTLTAGHGAGVQAFLR